MNQAVNKPFDLSEKYWGSLSAEHQALYALVRPQPKAAYNVDYPLRDVETFLVQTAANMNEVGGTFELEPDFQRGHVWSDDQRRGYIESLLRATAPTRILFNCPGLLRSECDGDIPSHTFQCIDGLQRLTDVRKFMAGDLKIFNGLSATDLKGSPFDVNRQSRFCLQFSVYEFSTRADLLQFYLDLNGGGTIHSQSELGRVRKLRDEAQTSFAGPVELASVPSAIA